MNGKLIFVAAFFVLSSKVSASQPVTIIKPLKTVSPKSTSLPVDGRIAVPSETLLYPTAADAEAETKLKSESEREPESELGGVGPVLRAPPAGAQNLKLSIYRIVESRENVVRVTNESVVDCARDRESYLDLKYNISAYVAKRKLLPRLIRTVLVENPDGTGVRILPGAPLHNLVEGREGVFWDPTLAKAAGAVPLDFIGLSVPPDPERGPDWTLKLERLVCDPTPEAFDSWRARKEEKQTAEEAQKEYQACRAREEAERRRAAKEKAGLISPLGQCESVLNGVTRIPQAPLCTIREEPLGTHSSFVGVNPANGNFVAEIARACAVSRVGVRKEDVTQSRSGQTERVRGVGSSSAGYYFPRRKSLVTWPNGSLAGEVWLSGPVPVSEYKRIKDGRMCRRVAPFAAPLCQKAADLCRKPSCIR